jgi:hypothetical protein
LFNIAWSILHRDLRLDMPIRLVPSLSCGNSEAKMSLGISRHWVDNIKVDLGEMEHGDVSVD